MTHEHGSRFPFEKHEKLDDAARRERQPAAPAVEALDLAPAHVVLDLGAGTGYFTLPLAQRLGAGHVLAMDVEPRMLELLRTRAAEAGVAPRVEPIHLADERSPRLPLKDQVVDRALVANLYHELPDRRASLAELHRVLRSGGRILVVDWDPQGTADAGPPVHHRVSAAQVEKELGEFGFRQVERLPLYRDHYAIRAVR